jgi:FkbM family methyltransferase
VFGGVTRRIRWAIWHPHQRLWTWPLVRRLERYLPDPMGRWAARTLVLIDSLLLLGQVVLRRRRTVSRPLVGRPTVLYIDCGTHKEASELRQVVRWLGNRCDLHILAFEASPAHFKDAEQSLGDLPNVRLLHIALVGPNHQGDTVKLHRSGGDGRADSLFASRGTEYDVVPAKRLSQVLLDEGWDIRCVPTLLRMNVEGAERFIVEDLVETGLHRDVDGYYGLWDDLSKIDPDADDEFRRLLHVQGISKVTFNDRDLPIALRRSAIHADLMQSIGVGMARTAT